MSDFSGFTMGSMTLGERRQFRTLAGGRSMEDFARDDLSGEDMDTMLIALAVIAGRRTDPSYSETDALDVTMDEMMVLMRTVESAAEIVPPTPPAETLESPATVTPLPLSDDASESSDDSSSSSDDV